ncbi:MAG: hypothetical protein CFE30_15335 [Bradyrhizobium sp. PARBB1]|nr:MAG: hypothetical protein CFE30_15335 [Bradyrhizobium sp. PARBB1]
MQGSFQVAQATGTGNSTNSAPVRIYTLTKPLTDQAVVINLGYDQKVKVDFSAIAKEKITLVHVGDKLIILFDNQSTITVEPFFDSRADGNVTIEMAPGRDVSVQEFAGLFPIGTDSSVLPAADNGGNSNGNAQASGANFSPFTIDALDPVGTNVLAGPEPLPNFVTPPQTGPFVLQQPAVVAPTIVVNSIASLTLSEANLTAATNGVDGSTHNLALTHVTGNFAVDFADKAGSTGISSVSYALSIPANGTLSGLIDSQSHQNDVLVQVNATTIEGHVGSATGALAFTISVNPATGVVTFTEDRAVDNNAGPVSLAAGTVTLTQTVVDSDGGKASASVDLGPKLSISDDHPTANPDTATAQDGGPAVTVLTGNVASVMANDVSGADTPINVTAVVATSNGNLAGTVGTALTGEFGKLTLNADGTFSYTANHNVLVGSKDVFTYTITDDDGTTSSTTLTITIAAGQGPVAGSDSSLSVNESALAPNGSGAHLTPDGATTQVSFTAGADDLHVTLNASALTTLLAGFPNLVWTTAAGGQEIVGTQNGVTVVKFDITAGATIAAGTTGQVTVTETLVAAIQGEGSKSPDLGTLNVVATDTLNGGSVTDHITANVVDDKPIWTSADHGVIANVAGISVTGGLQFVTGADGLGLIYFTGVSTDPLHPTATTIQSGGFAVSEYVDANGVLHGVANGAEVFKVVLDPTTSTYTFYLEHALDSYTPLAVNPAKLGGSGPVWYATLADTSGNPVTILTGYHTTPFFDVNSWFNETHDTLNFFQLSQDTVKASSTGEGVHSNVFDAGDFMRFDFGSVGDNSHGDTWIYGTAFGAPAVATGNQISFSVKTLGGGPSIIDYVVHSIDGTVTHGVYNSSTDGAGFTANGHGNIDYVEMYEVCGKSKILLAGITELVNNGQTDVPFTVGVKDGDGDIASGSFDVNVNGGTTLSGTAGNDVIVAGATNETLTGNGGNDKFVLNLAAHFTISDFNSGDLVLLDVSGLSLPAGASNPLTASQFTTSAATGGTENNATAWNESGSANKFFFNNATHELWYSANGTGSDKVDLAHLSTGVPAAANIHIF